MSTHIEAKAGEIARIYSSPGSLRAKFFAEAFLDDRSSSIASATCSDTREPGTGGRLGHGDGHGQPSLSIYANELYGNTGQSAWSGGHLRQSGPRR
jgi:purine-nucleoside phosphorylase